MINIRDSRNKKGTLTYSSGEERKKIIEGLEVYDVKTKEKIKIKNL